jgi:ABC-type ATPase involved in cell division/GNAT superfamily N-acetyltransferase
MKIECTIRRSSPVVTTARVLQMSGMFDVQPSPESVVEWRHSFDLPEPWNIGVIVGPSGAGKTTLAREAFGDQIVSGWTWPADKSLLDGFPAGMGVKDVVGLLSSVGFSSPPAWLRPFHVLSNGEQFRVNLARTMAEMPELAVVDEFSSVVDRTVARIGSAALQKAVRRRGGKLVAVTCHYDVLDWLEPDWVYEPHTGKLERGRLRRRPKIQLDIHRTTTAAWQLFKGHHYLSRDLHRGSHCFAATVEGRPAAFCAVLSFPHAQRPGWREHRVVCLPDFQGVGIGEALSNYVAGLFAASGKPYWTKTSHPGHRAAKAKSPQWRTRYAGSLSRPIGRTSSTGGYAGLAIDRATWSFEYTGPANPVDAAAFGLTFTPAPAPVRSFRARLPERGPAGRGRRTVRRSSPALP